MAYGLPNEHGHRALHALAPHNAEPAGAIGGQPGATPRLQQPGLPSWPRKPFELLRLLPLLLVMIAPRGAWAGDWVASLPGGLLVAIVQDTTRVRDGYVLERRYPDGSPDPQFGDGGSLVFSLGNDNEGPAALRLGGRAGGRRERRRTQWRLAGAQRRQRRLQPGVGTTAGGVPGACPSRAAPARPSPGVPRRAAT
jgi:hypothetical protein